MASQHHADDHAPNVKLYAMVFGALMVLTGVTVAISKVHLPPVQAVVLGLFVAAVKASLVAAVFMHLWGEKRLIHHFIWVTLFAGALVFIGWHDSMLVRPRLTSRMDVAGQKPSHESAGKKDARPGEAMTENAPPARLNKPKAEQKKGASAR